ncbi:MAG: hypothetical protein ACK8QZ_06220 [Anaerolineales bacterium]
MRLFCCALFFLALVACAPAPTGVNVISTVEVPAAIKVISSPPVTVSPVPTFSIPTMLPIPYLPRESDTTLTRGPVFLKNVDILVMESYPPQYVLSLEGSLPTPGHELRVQAQPPDAEGNIRIEVYSVADARRICVQVLKPFAVQMPLLSGAGEYTFWVNGKRIGGK